MKRFLVIVLNVLFLLSCKKDEHDVPAEPYHASAMVNNVAWSCYNPLLASGRLFFQNSIQQHTLVLTLSPGELADGSTSYISMLVYNQLKKGKFYFRGYTQSNPGPTYSRAIYYLVDGGPKEALAIDGYLEITNLGLSTISGTFEFQAITSPSENTNQETFEVQKGTFHVPLINVSEVPWYGPKG
ncbi:hypothetical protein [Rufibacter sp. LB8]|uniref:hypothetical protein n=1 Tax=Rufibacter sp. LB8 TaxID=2777781 RepID=UPI00178C7573|nr:hypothetical protein [Rufibacter sp. LB8]